MNYQVLEETYQSLITDPNKKEWLENNWKEIMTEFSDLLIEKVESSVEPDKVKVLEKILMENKISNAHKIIVEFETALKEQEKTTMTSQSITGKSCGDAFTFHLDSGVDAYELIKDWISEMEVALWDEGKNDHIKFWETELTDILAKWQDEDIIEKDAPARWCRGIAVLMKLGVILADDENGLTVN